MANSLLLQLILMPLAFVFFLIVALRNLLFDFKILKSRRLGKPVVSVGNLAVGGTGKSPFVVMLVRALRARGHVAGILTRGYKSGLDLADVMVLLGGKVVASNFSPEKPWFADEAMMQSHALPDTPIVVGVDRYKAALFFESQALEGIKLWVMDDGFQHRRLMRDLDILLFDAANPWGRGWVMPAGFLREGLSGARRAQVAVFTRADDRCELEGFRRQLLEVNPNLFICESKQAVSDPRHVLGEECSLNEVNMVCALANPDRFRHTLRELGLTVASEVVKGDHEKFFCGELLARLKKGTPIVTTEKDYWRDRQVFAESGFSVYLIPISFSLDKRCLDGVLDRIYF